MRIVTTVHPEGYREYGHRWVTSRPKWNAEAWFYCDGFDLPYTPAEQELIEQCGCGDQRFWIERRDILDIPGFADWRLRHAHYHPPSWQWDVVKYAHKVFAACDALEHYPGIGVWLDADCVTQEDIPAGLIPELLGDAYLACFQRTGLYTETGLWLMNCAHPEHKRFLHAWKEWYLAGKFKNLTQWHDCMTLDATIRQFGDRISVKSLSEDHDKAMHPMAVTKIAQYVDHLKGTRKAKGFSPENRYAAARV